MKSGYAACLALLMVTPRLWGHAIVQPDHVQPGSFEKFVLRVPTEKPIPTTQVRLLIPDNLQVFSLGGKVGWRHDVEKDSSGRLKSITWSGGTVPAGEFIDFEFVARAPMQPGSLIWKAYQKYEDGTLVAWVGPPDSSEPASITRVEPAKKPYSSPPWVSWSALALSVLAVLLSGYSVFQRA